MDSFADVAGDAIGEGVASAIRELLLSGAVVHAAKLIEQISIKRKTLKRILSYTSPVQFRNKEYTSRVDTLLMFDTLPMFDTLYVVGLMRKPPYELSGSAPHHIDKLKRIEH